jgi:SAM-dependent methyltransferase
MLRKLDGLLDPPQQVSAVGGGSNGRERSIVAFLNRLQLPDSGADAYLKEHQERIVRTLSLLPLGSPQSRALELGSYLHMAAALNRVLDYGCVRAAYYSPAIGREVKSLAVAGEPSYTTDVDLFDVELHTYPYEDCSFDVVLCCEIIEHLVRDPMHMLLECRRILCDAGLLALTTPNMASLTSVAAALRGEENPQVFARYPAPGNNDVPHVREYTPSEVVHAVSAAGFTIEVLITERTGAEHATWVRDILSANGFDGSLRGEQIYCLARKSTAAAIDRYPEFLYSR